LTSMGDVGGRSMEQLTQQAERLAGSSLFEDDQILRQVTANLLTFGNVAGDAFDRAQQAAVDLATRMGTDLQSATIMIGKALNAPADGLAALRRVGIQFTDDQQAMIEQMVAVGDTAGAQAVMLAELERQFGGSAQAARENAAPMERMRLALAGLAGEIGSILLPIIDRVASAFESLTARFSTLSPQMQQVIVVVAALAAALGPVLVVLGGAVAAIGALVASPLLPFIAAAAAAAAGLAAVFAIWGDELVPMLQTFGQQLADVLGPKVQPLFEAVRGLVDTLGAAFSAVFGGEGSAGVDLTFFGEIIARTFGAAVDMITGAVEFITNIFRALGALLRGDFSAMWGYLGSAVMALTRAVTTAFSTMFPEVVNWVRQTYEGVRQWLVDRFNALVRQIGERVQAVGNFFRDLYIAVVGNSWIPDMVRAVADWMGPRLQDAMVNPALDATSATGEAFQGLGSSVEGTMDNLFRSIASKDWKGVLGGVLDILGGTESKLGSFARLGSSILKALPGFATGGSFKVGGSGGVDSQLMAFRATPGEMVDIRRPGQVADSGALSVHVAPSPYFDVRVERVAAPVAARAGVQAFGAARSQVPADLSRQQTYRRTRF
jgi:hypothetical protein